MYGEPWKGYKLNILTTEQKEQTRKDLAAFQDLKKSPMSNSGELLAITQRVLETLAIHAGVFDEGAKNG